MPVRRPGSISASSSPRPTAPAKTPASISTPKSNRPARWQSVEEGCLSLPGLYAKIRRNTQCTVTATDLDGNRFTESAEGLLARAFQHEFDHLEGKLIKDRLTRIQQIAARHRLRELMEEYENPSS